MRKIMFNDRYGLTQAVIAGRKTMTRRVLSGYPLMPSDRIEDVLVYPDGYVSIIANGGENLMTVKCHYKVGEIVAVAQSYKSIADKHPDMDTFLLQLSKAYGCELEAISNLPGWENKMFTRGELMPYRIRISGIKCERLQDISSADCLKEGIRQAYAESILEMYGYIDYKGTGLWLNTPHEAFASLIDKVSGKGRWERNPWVIVYEFDLLSI